MDWELNLSKFIIILKCTTLSGQRFTLSTSSLIRSKNKSSTSKISIKQPLMTKWQNIIQLRSPNCPRFSSSSGLILISQLSLTLYSKSENFVLPMPKSNSKLSKKIFLLYLLLATLSRTISSLIWRRRPWKLSWLWVTIARRTLWKWQEKQG